MISLSGINHGYQNLKVIANFDLQVDRGEVCAIIGRSGCGKSTLLRIGAGIEKPNSGTVRIMGKQPPLDDRGKIGFAFQNPALVSWKSSLENVLLPTRLMRKHVQAQTREFASNLLSEFGMSEFTQSKPSELSGGMKRRVGLARSLVTQPELLFLDEPFGELDEVLKWKLALKLRDRIQIDSLTSIIVTHSIDTAVFLADRIICLSDRPAQILKVWRPARRFHDPLQMLQSSEYAALYREIYSILAESS